MVKVNVFDFVFIRNIQITLISLKNKMFYKLEERRHTSIQIFTCNLELEIVQIKSWERNQNTRL